MEQRSGRVRRRIGASVGAGVVTALVAGLGVVVAAATPASADHLGVTVGGRVWHDTDRDGLQDPGEPGLPGVPVALQASRFVAPIVQATTDAAGNYSFSNGHGASTPSAVSGITELTPGSTWLLRVPTFPRVPVLDGLVPTLHHVGTDPTVDSDLVTDRGVDQAEITVGADGTVDDTVDLGFAPFVRLTCVGTPLRVGFSSYGNTASGCWNQTVSEEVSSGNLNLPGVLAPVVSLLPQLSPLQQLAFNVQVLRSSAAFVAQASGAADASVSRITLNLPGAVLVVDGVHSQASAVMPSGCVPLLTGSSTIGSVTLNGVPILTGVTQPVTIPLGVATLHLNQRLVAADHLWQRGVFVDFAGQSSDVVVGESFVGATCAQPG